MRAKTIKPHAYIFDFDDTLVKTDAKTHVLKNGKRIKSLTPAEYNTHKLKKGEVYDRADFVDPRFILDAIPYKMWDMLKGLYNRNKIKGEDSVFYILTARSPASQHPIRSFLKNNDIIIPLEHIITIGNDEGKEINTAEEKAEVLKVFSTMYEVYFFDDSEDNVKIAGKIPGVRTKLVDWNI